MDLGAEYVESIYIMPHTLINLHELNHIYIYRYYAIVRAYFLIQLGLTHYYFLILLILSRFKKNYVRIVRHYKWQWFSFFFVTFYKRLPLALDLAFKPCNSKTYPSCLSAFY